MSSPFPGMDPYLEDPALWPDVHHGLISETQAELNRCMGPGYYARVEERVYISDDDDPGRTVNVPDVRIGRSPRPNGQAAKSASLSGLQIAEPLLLDFHLDEEIHEARLEVLDRKNRRLVTVVEVISPTNKIAGSEGRKSFLKKRKEILGSLVNWVEIDLLRIGEPLIPREVLPLGDYFVHAACATSRPRGKVWPIRLQERLPVVGIPLKESDPDVALDLQQVLDTVYNRAAYDRTIDYRRPPEVPLTRKHAAWANRLLKDKGLR